MINAQMRSYNYFSLGTLDEYGQQVESTEPVGAVKMAINITSQSIQDNINYSNCQYVGLTYNKEINDKSVIQYGDKKLKVLYVNPKGRINQVFMAEQ